MIELIYNEAEKDLGKDSNLKLPKNIRQIGAVEEKKKIYVEDYVITYINQYATSNLNTSRAAVLLGQARYHEGCLYIFISSAVEVEQVEFGIDEIKFNEHAWTGIYENMKQFFDNQEIVGWFLSVPGFPVNVTEGITKAHVNNFAGNDKVLMMLEPIENEEAFYTYDNGYLNRQGGYYIYYEKNDAMQEYMIYKHEGKRVDSEAVITDQAAQSFRTIIREKKEVSSQKRLMTFMYTASTFLVMIVLIIGITMINNYDKMQSMEDALAVISKNVSNNNREEMETIKNQDRDAANEANSSNKIPVESVSGNLQQGAGAGTITDIGQKPATGADDGNGTGEGVSADGQQQDNGTEQTGGQAQPPAADSSDALGQDAAGAKGQEPPKDQAGAEDQAPQKDQAGAEAPPKDEGKAAASTPKYYTILKGDTLADISKKVYGNDKMISKICELNQIDNGDKVFVGQKILLP